MISEMDKEVDGFLQSVNALTETDLIPPPVIAATSEDDGQQSSVEPVAKKGMARHRWKHQHLIGEYYDKTLKEKKYCNPFLDDKNTQAAYQSQRVLIVVVCTDLVDILTNRQSRSHSPNRTNNAALPVAILHELLHSIFLIVAGLQMMFYNVSTSLQK